MKITEQQIRRLVYSAWDFQQALSAMVFLLEECVLEGGGSYTNEELRKYRCYETQAIISFCRTFIPSRAKVMLSLKSLGVSLTDEEHALKKRLLDLRNKIIAHSDSEQMHYKGSVIALDIELNREGKSFRFPFNQYDEWLYLESQERYVLKELLVKLIRAVAEKEVSLCQIYPELFSSYQAPAEKRPFDFREIDVEPPLRIWRGK